MDPEPPALPRERAASSEPCSTRPNPFDHDNGSSSRKRQRVSRRVSRSRSVDTVAALETTSDSMSSVEETSPSTAGSAPPQTPPRPGRATSPEPASSKVTINLRTPLEPIPSSPPSPTPPSKMPTEGPDFERRDSIGSGSDELSTIPAPESPSSSSVLNPDSPEIEVVTINEDGDDFTAESPPLAIIDEDDLFVDPIHNFPFRTEGESLATTMKRLCYFVQYDPVEDDSCFRKLRDWIDSYLTFTHDHPDTWHESYTTYRQFWNNMPEMIMCLSWRSRFFSEFIDRNRSGYQSLSGFFRQFARLTGRFVALDMRTLADYAIDGSDQGPDLASRPYLNAYSHLIRKEDNAHVGRNLEAHYHWDWDEEVTSLTTAFEATGATVANLAKFVERQVKLLSRFPKLIENLADPSRLIARVLTQDAKALEDPQRYRQSTENSRQRLLVGHEFFQSTSAALQLVIEEQVTALTPDAALALASSLSNIRFNTLRLDDSTIRPLLAAKSDMYPDLPANYIPKAISLEWKFTVLKSLIMSAQMQLRVIGVTTMCADLLALHGKYKGNDASQSPMLLHFADFVIRNKIIEYLVGIASHPEIINESSNILGFLIVTNTYKNSQASTIWQTVTTSQDPRVVEAILRMLQRCLNLQRYQDLVYICKKAKSLPVGTFTLPMREFCDEVFKMLLDKAAYEGVQQIDAAPYELCVWLIRESSKVTTESPAGYPDIQNFAAARFRDLLGRGLSDRTREEIYLDCTMDVSSGAASAPGSICVINGLLRQNQGADLHTLTTDHGLTNLVVQELESAIAGGDPSLNQLVRNSPASLARRELLLTIIVNEPGTITPELGTKLWDLLVGCESRSAIDRNTSWHILNSAMKKSSLNNTFIATCFRTHLPTLPPDCFTAGALDFTGAALFAWLDEARPDFVDEDRSFESPALEQLWRLILTAPPNTIDSQAIRMLVEVYLESSLILSLTRARVRNIHSTLVDRCLRQLASAAAKLKAFDQEGASSDSDTTMTMVASETEFQDQELIFARSLAVLREFLKSYQTKPQFATPKAKSSLSGTSNAVDGEPVTVKYQSFDGGKQTEVMSLTLGKLNTAGSLFTSLQKATGFKNFKLYCGGKGLDPGDIEVSKSLEELNLNGLVLVQRRSDEEMPSVAPGAKTTLEVEIMKHFDELWGYLAMHDKVAQEIYSFLIKFPIYDVLIAAFDSDTVSYKEVFPQGQPFKSLYAIYAMREYIRMQSQNGAMDNGALNRTTALSVAAISDPEVLEQLPPGELRDSLALSLIDSLVTFLREPVIPASIETLLNDTLLQRLLQLINTAKSAVTSHNSAHLTWRTFEALMEVSLYNPALWTSLKSHLASSPLLQDLLLDDPRPVIRKSVAKQIMTKCSFTPPFARVSTTEFVASFWPLVVGLIVPASQQPERCEELFGLALALFKRLAEISLEFISLEELVREWCALLLYTSPSKENAGQLDTLDTVTQGLANLCYTATTFAKASRQRLSCNDLGAKLFRKYLFPNLSAEDIDNPDRPIVSKLPFLNPTTRHVISEVVFHLVKDDEAEYKNVLIHISALTPYEPSDNGPYVYDLPFLFERNKSIRSPTGYVGLRNLSNTCYLNSLFTQLFMNVPFREFMLNAPVADPGGSQKLLAETQNIFGFMQNSLRKYVDPTSLAASIRTYEETHIDVSIQMDVDEFYNLIFDRWESQIPAADAKKQFRSFYGGQLVQQVKSKECPHISERLEPFSAIQCDIKGKSSLEESLQAYVDGEVLEGDNKYKCSTCDRHVDAVKRACLKGIPDNLIFHLKRFEFNLRTLQRSKINDYFSFPEKIDMRPYKVEHLMDNPEETPEDWFELVGILVHSGTAESGHYYSYIRERPSNSPSDNWVEFNDDNVSHWEPKSMEASCFGGVEYRGTAESGGSQFDKSYSAYMLFYQRSSFLATQKEGLEKSEMTSPIRLPIAPRLFNHITMENELLLRKYCLYDPSHSTFVGKMLSNIKHINKGCCSESHTLEKLSMLVALNHLDQVVSRAKDTPDFTTFIVGLRQMCNDCAECSRDFLEWFSDRPDCLRHLLLRNPDAMIRSEMASSILAALIKVKADAAYAYGLGEDGDNSDEMDSYEDPRLLQGVVRAMTKLWDMFHNNCRAWPEYFGLLTSIANLGQHEAAVILDSGYLRRTLEVVSADSLLPLSTQYQRMLTIISKRVATRPVSYDAMLALLHVLMETCDLSAASISEDEERLGSSLSGGTVPLTHTEKHLLMQHWTRGQAHILTEKLLQIHQNYHSTRSILIMLLHFEDPVDHNVFQAIVQGIKRGLTVPPAAPFLRAALTYCEYSGQAEAISNMIAQVSKVAAQIENSEGKEFSQFYKDVIDLERNRTRVSREAILKLCLDHSPLWSPPLLNYYDPAIRVTAERFVTENLLVYGPDVDFGTSAADVDKANALVMTAQRLGIGCLDHLNETYVKTRQPAVRATLENIVNVIEGTAAFFDQDPEDDMNRRFLDLRASVLPSLRRFTVEEIDEELSDWEASDGEYGSSEPMDSIAELCEGISDDLDSGT